MNQPLKVFISYSHTDVKWLQELAPFLKPIEGKSIVEQWDDRRLTPGQKWRDEIRVAVDSAQVAILFVSAEFLASDFISTNELPQLLKKASAGGTTIMPIIVSPCGFDRHPELSLYQAVNAPSDTVLGMDDVKRKTLFKRVADLLEDLTLKRASNLLPDAQSKTNVSADLSRTTLDNPRSTVVDCYEYYRPEWLPRSNLGRELLEQVIEFCRIFHFQFSLPEQEVKPVRLFVTPNIFLPDDWTRTLLTGLFKIWPRGLPGKTIVEIGVGTGVMPIALASNGFGFEKFFGFDIDLLAVRVARLNVAISGLSEVVLLKGGRSTFEADDGLYDGDPYVDLVIANLPQVPTLSATPLRDQLFDYYPMPVTLTSDEETWAMQGLLLIARVLREARQRLKPGGTVVLNVAGRPKKAAINQFFEAIEYTCTDEYKARVRQESGTDISAFAYFERTQGLQYEFFRKAQPNAVSVDAKTACKLLARAEPCYHDLYVIKAVPS